MSEKKTAEEKTARYFLMEAYSKIQERQIADEQVEVILIEAMESFLQSRRVSNEGADGEYTYQWTARGTRIYKKQILIAHVYGTNGGVDTAKLICELLSSQSQNIQMNPR